LKGLILNPEVTMSDMLDPRMPHRRPHPQSMATAYLEFDLERELEHLHQEPGWTTGQNAKTLIKYDDFRVVLIALRARSGMPGHQTEGRISIQIVRGHIQVRAEGRTFDLPVGSLLALDRGLAHDVEALEDSALLLTIAWPER
jgi:quercetin dioxygenase-like cupin family protein